MRLESRNPLKWLVMETIQLSESHQRRLETLLHIIEMRLGELQVDLNRQMPPITYHLEPPLSEDQQTLLSHQIEAIRDELAQLMRKYGLAARHLLWSQRLNALHLYGLICRTVVLIR